MLEQRWRARLLQRPYWRISLVVSPHVYALYLLCLVERIVSVLLVRVCHRTVCVCVCEEYLRVYMCVSVCMCVCVYVLYTYIHMWIHTCIYKCIHIYTCIYIYTYTVSMYICRETEEATEINNERERKGKREIWSSRREKRLYSIYASQIQSLNTTPELLLLIVHLPHLSSWYQPPLWSTAPQCQVHNFEPPSTAAFLSLVSLLLTRPVYFRVLHMGFLLLELVCSIGFILIVLVDIDSVQ